MSSNQDHPILPGRGIDPRTCLWCWDFDCQKPECLELNRKAALRVEQLSREFDQNLIESAKRAV